MIFEEWESLVRLQPVCIITTIIMFFTINNGFHLEFFVKIFSCGKQRYNTSKTTYKTVYLSVVTYAIQKFNLITFVQKNILSHLIYIYISYLKYIFLIWNIDSILFLYCLLWKHISRPLHVILLNPIVTVYFFTLNCIVY